MLPRIQSCTTTLLTIIPIMVPAMPAIFSSSLLLLLLRLSSFFYYYFYCKYVLNLYQSEHLTYSLVMLYSRYALFTAPPICVLSAIFYFRHNLSQSFSPIASEYDTVPKHPSLRNVTTVDPSLGPSEPRIVQVSMLFGEEDDEIYQRCLDTHFEHGKRWMYETRVLRQEIRTHKYFLLNKTLYVLSYLLTEMAKKPDERARWIV